MNDEQIKQMLLKYNFTNVLQPYEFDQREGLTTEIRDLLAQARKDERQAVIEKINSEEYQQKCYWRYWYKTENNPDTNYAAGYERCLTDLLAQLEKESEQ